MSRKNLAAGLVLSAVLLIGAGVGLAATEQDGAQPVVAGASSPHATNYAALVTQLSHGSLKLLNTFPGPDGLTGIMAEPADGNGRKTLAWGLNGKLLIPGPVLDADGRNLTMQALRAQGLLPKPMATVKLAAAMLQAPGFVVGSKGPLIAVFLDPNCIFCHRFWQDAWPLAESGNLRFKVVPVGFLKPDSLPKAATILMRKDRVRAWEKNESGFNAQEEEGGTVPAKTLDTKVVREIQANTRLLGESGEIATPTVAACLDHGKEPKVFHGLAPGMLKDLARGQSLQPDGLCTQGRE